MYIERATSRSVKKLATGVPAYTQKLGERYLIAVDSDKSGLERFKVYLSAEEVEGLVLQIPATQLIQMLGNESATEFMRTLKKVLTVAKEQFIEIAFRTKSVALIQQANVILTANVKAGYTMTLRQLYYQLVQSGVIDNNKNSYERLGSLMNDARRAGLVDWAAIEDRGRNLNRWTLYTDPNDFLTKMVRYYLEDIWKGQDTYLEAGIEKDALIGVLERPCGHYRVPYMAFRGYPSTSELYAMAKRFDKAARAGKRTVLLYLGDHDPAGVDIPRSSSENLDLFCRSAGVELRRIALNMDQIEALGIVSDQTTKAGDSKSSGYEDTYGTDICWELDALTNQYIDDLVRAEIVKCISDPDMFEKRRVDESANETLLREVAENYPDVRKYLKYRDTEVQLFDGEDTTWNADEMLDTAQEQDSEDGTKD